jgi:hypothetical protein
LVPEVSRYPGSPIWAGTTHFQQVAQRQVQRNTQLIVLPISSESHGLSLGSAWLHQQHAKISFCLVPRPCTNIHNDKQFVQINQEALHFWLSGPAGFPCLTPPSPSPLHVKILIKLSTTTVLDRASTLHEQLSKALPTRRRHP